MPLPVYNTVHMMMPMNLQRIKMAAARLKPAEVLRIQQRQAGMLAASKQAAAAAAGDSAEAAEAADSTKGDAALKKLQAVSLTDDEGRPAAAAALAAAN